MSDLTHIYCFGPCQDRKSPLYVFGPVLGGRSSRNPEIPALFLVGMWNAGKGRDGEDEGTGKRMMKKASYGNVHVSQRPRILPGYPNHLSLRRGEKGQKFWSPKCRATYLSLARTIGR
jgi:hypothetical protein